MPFLRRLKRLAVRIRRYLTVGPTIVGYLMVGLGLPLPLPTFKDTSQPFPCQDHVCGCRNAEQCWKHCCCFTLEERLAWARAHHVDPPADINVNASQAADPSDREPSAGIATGDRPACPCCAGGSRQQPSNPTSRATRKITWTMAISAQHCHGDGGLWLGANPAWPPPPWVTWNYSWATAGWLHPKHFLAFFLSLSPPEPPPRGSVLGL